MGKRARPTGRLREQSSYLEGKSYPMAAGEVKGTETIGLYHPYQPDAADHFGCRSPIGRRITGHSRLRKYSL